MKRREFFAADPAQASLFEEAMPDPTVAARPHAHGAVAAPRRAVEAPPATPGCAADPALAPAPEPDAAPAANIAPAADVAPTAPSTPLAEVLAPVVFRHPQADREIGLGEHRVGYRLRRGRRRSIGFVVGPEGLSVSAPRWVGVREIESALREKGPWILKKLGEQQARARRLLATKIEWRDGTAVPFLGESVIVVLDPRAGAATGGAQLDAEAEGLPGVPRRLLRVGLAHTATPVQIRDTVQSWLQRQARRIFEERCRVYAERLGVRVTRLGLSSAETRWGSANASGAIRLNWRLVHFALPTIDYVVAHELAHLREMNHSPRFWDVVRSVLPDYETARGGLKGDGLPAFE